METTLLATAMMALASLGATLLLSRRAAADGTDFGTALLRLAQALPLAVAFLYGHGAWWTGPVAILLGVAAGLGAARVTGGATLAVGVVALAMGLSYMASVILRFGPPN
ncbi:hypothetical protein ACE7GA_18405 [Roseomonas sp. CCTCC AB2023176]|uniref:hypothetical protein n=1 Tax=Roseomonas sp. CCTCC AB2023176 TaxID=3342640 RepID=UPI0035E130F2